MPWINSTALHEMVDKKALIDSLQYISLPESMLRTINGFQFRSDIMLPTEPGQKALNWEAIISAVLKILAYVPDHEHSDYYRRLVFAIDPDIVGRLGSASIVKAKSRDWDFAEELFLTLVGLEPNNARSVLNLALMYEQCSEDYQGMNELQKVYEERALHQYLRALEIGEGTEEVHLYAGYFFLRQKSFSRAEKELSHFMEIAEEGKNKEQVAAILEQLAGSSKRDALFKETFDFIWLGQEQKALERIDKLLKSHSDLWDAWFLKGWALRRLKRYQEAYRAFSSARSLGGNSIDLLNEMAICAMEGARLEEAKLLLLDALKQSPSDVKILSNLGLCALKMDDVPAAQKHFHHVLSVDSSNAIARRYLQEIADRR